MIYDGGEANISEIIIWVDGAFEQSFFSSILDFIDCCIFL